MAIGEKEIDVFGDFPVSILRTQQNKLLKNHVATLQNIKSVLSVGALQTDVDKEGEAYRNYFPDAQFYTLDKFRKDVHDKHLCMDLHDLSMMDKNFDLLLCMCVLEHVENPFQVAEQIVSCMHKGCYLFVCVPFFTQYINVRNLAITGGFQMMQYGSFLRI